MIATKTNTQAIFSNYAQGLLLGLTFMIVFHKTLMGLVGEWSNNPDFSHGFLIPAAVGWMVWTKRGALVGSALDGAPLGLLVVLVGLALHVFGSVGSEFFTSRVAVIVTIVGLTLYLLGWEVTRRLSVPLAYLMFMIPIPAIIWNQISFPLQLLASSFAANCVALIGIPILREGNVLHLATTKLEVVNACSGLRSLMSLSALSCVMAYLSSLSRTGKWILFLAAIPIAIVANVIRLVSTAVMVHYFGQSLSEEIGRAHV